MFSFVTMKTLKTHLHGSRLDEGGQLVVVEQLDLLHDVLEGGLQPEAQRLVIRFGPQRNSVLKNRKAAS